MVRYVFILFLLVGISGCVGQPARSESNASPRTSIPSDWAQNSEKYTLMVRLNIASIEIPAGTASESEPLWSYLNEESVNLVRTPVLGFNGLRIGIGIESSSTPAHRPRNRSQRSHANWEIRRRDLHMKIRSLNGSNVNA